MDCPWCPDVVHASDDVDPCPGDCNDGWIAAERTAFEKAKKAPSLRARRELLDHGVPMVAAAPVWCRPCQEHIAETIAGLPSLCVTLMPGALNTGRTADGGSHPAAVIPPSPSPAWDQADEIIRWAVNTEDMLRHRIGDPGRGPRPWRALSSACYYLVEHVTPLLSCPDAVAIGFDVLRMSRRLTKVTGADRVVHRLPGECMACGRKGLQRKDGDDLVKCRACGACWDFEYYQFLAHAHAQAVRAR